MPGSQAAAPSTPLSSHGDAKQFKTIGDIYNMMGWGRYSTFLFICCGMGWTADSIEAGLLSYLKPAAELEWSAGASEVNLLTVMVFVGEMLGSFVWGPLGDRFGRRITFMLVLLNLVVFGFLSAVVSDLWMLIAARAIVGIGISGMVIPFDMLVESTKESQTTLTTIGCQVFWTMGTLYVNACAAVINKDSYDGIAGWRLLTIVALVPIVLSLLSVYWVEESPLWLQEQGRDEEAMAVLKRVAARSGVALDNVELVSYSHELSANLCDVVKPPFLIRTLVFCVMIFLALLGYYGVSMMSEEVFSQKTDSTVAISNTVGATNNVAFGPLMFAASGETAGVLCMAAICYIGKTDRTVIYGTMAGFLLSAAATLMLLLRDMHLFSSFTVQSVFVFFARMGCMQASAGYMLIVPKAYPTYIRCTGHAFVMFFGRAGGMACGVTGDFSLPSKFVTYSLANIAAALLCGIALPYLDGKEKAFDVVSENLHASACSVERASTARANHSFGVGSRASRS